MIWRGALWGFGAGIVLGALYGLIAPELLVLADKLAGATSYAVNMNYAFEVFFISVTGGALAGWAFGLLIGLVAGAAIGGVTHARFNPLRDAARYRSTVARVAVGIVVVIGVSLLVLVLLTVKRISFAQVLYESVALILIPTLVAVIVARVVSLRLANWYVKQSSGEMKNV